MSQSIYTRCPECSTVFRVTEQHLKLAKGRVRCGACLHIFKATEHLVRPKDADQEGSEKNESTADRGEKSHSMDKLHELQQQAYREESTDETEDSHDLLTAPPSAEMDIHYSEKKAQTTQYPIGNFAKENNNKSEQAPAGSDDISVRDDNSTENSVKEEIHPVEQEAEPNNNQEAKLSDTAEPFEPSMDDIDAFVETPDSTTLNNTIDNTIDTNIDGPTTPMDVEEATDASSQGSETSNHDANWSQAPDHGEFEFDDDEQQETLEHSSLEQETLEQDAQQQQATEQPQSEQEDLTPESTQSFNTSPLDVDDAAELESDEFESTESQFDQASSDDTDVNDFQNTDEQLFAEAETEANISEQFIDQESEFDHEDFPEQEESFEQENDLEQKDSLEPTESTLDDTESQTPSSRQQLNTGLSDQDLEPDPLDEFDDIVTRKQHKYKWLAASGLLLVLVSWGVYTLWSERQTLAWDDTWGPLVQTLCKAAPCAIEQRRDVAAIELLQRDIRPSDSDPDISDFRLMIQNNASFEQPYPTVEIHFTDTQGKILSTEVHTPDQYLSDELKTTQMPPNQKVLILVKAKQPHAQAFGFEFQFK